MNLVSIVTQTLDQVKVFLAQIHPEVYQAPLEIYSNSSIGQHTRHIIEFLQCLVEQSVSGEVNYDKRLRNKQIEQDASYATRAIDEIIISLHEKDLDLGKKITLGSCYHIEEEHTICTETTFERELVYNIEHAIHHLAIIKIGLKMVAPDIKLPPEFGVAPSTIRFHKVSGT